MEEMIAKKVALDENLIKEQFISLLQTCLWLSDLKYYNITIAPEYIALTESTGLKFLLNSFESIKRLTVQRSSLFMVSE